MAAAATVRPGVQPRELPAAPCVAEVREALVVDHATAEADQDRAKVVRHAKYTTFQLAEVAVPRELFAAILERIQRFGVPPPLVSRG